MNVGRRSRHLPITTLMRSGLLWAHAYASLGPQRRAHSIFSLARCQLDAGRCSFIRRTVKDFGGSRKACLSGTRDLGRRETLRRPRPFEPTLPFCDAKHAQSVPGELFAVFLKFRAGLAELSPGLFVI